MDLQFFGGSGAGSGRRVRGGGNETPQLLEPSPELDKIQPKTSYKQHIENSFNKMVRDYTDYLGENIEKDLISIEDKLRKMTNSNEVYVGIRFNNEVLGQILDDGRFKSQFETGTSKGILDNNRRNNFESKAMGYSKSTDPAKRPIYGMLFDGKTPADVRLSDRDLGSQYGGVVAIFKPNIKQYSTLTIGDSLDRENHMYPSPLLKPSRYSMPEVAINVKEMQHLAKQEKIKPSDYFDCFEVQVHGGHATTSNIDRIVFSKNIPKSDIPVNELKAHGIKWSIEK